MDRGGVQKAIKQVALDCGIRKNVHIHSRHSFATHLLENGVNLLGHASPPAWTLMCSCPSRCYVT
jgi:site-specific recombinase XerD